MKGVPLRLEVGPRDVEKNNVVLARRDTGEKVFLPKVDVIKKVPELLISIQENLFSQALEFREKNTHVVHTYDELKTIIKTGGFVRCGWDGKASTEAKIKEETQATIRCIPLDDNPKNLKCIYSSSPAKHEVIFAKAY
jgi:prolyl-tRNA synthetase